MLEISATPYLYTLRFYDWLRRDLDGHAAARAPRARVREPRPAAPAGAAVAATCPRSRRVVRSGAGWAELELGRLPELFFAVHRLDFDDAVEDDTGGRFHVLNLVEGEEVTVEPASGDPHALAYAETIVVPAAVGRLPAPSAAADRRPRWSRRS